ncbi:helix-turn-helix domain-containing protein [Thermopolyspora sp. NPDC052614]|uniref:TetR/AcrR family transcriptional regulator n=1 Tax=Thermopolyspora sp. NPDC052614 TaxID=3155682 RepID=UPI00343047B0
MSEELSLRERKKRETRQRISDTAMGLFMQHGFDKVTVADVARAADVSVNTVFNYFKTKEDLFLDRRDAAEDYLARVVRERPPGVSALHAIRDDFLDAARTQHWRYGFNAGADWFARLIAESPTLTARITQLHETREELLATALADAADAEPDDLTPRVIAAQINAVLRVLTQQAHDRRRAGEPWEDILPDTQKAAERAFALLEDGVADYPGRSSR